MPLAYEKPRAPRWDRGKVRAYMAKKRVRGFMRQHEVTVENFSFVFAADKPPI